MSNPDTDESLLRPWTTLPPSHDLSERTLLDISFEEFVSSSPGLSVRLVNAILRGCAATGPLPTVLDYWEDRKLARNRVAAIVGLGAKMRIELERRIAEMAVPYTSG